MTLDAELSQTLNTASNDKFDTASIPASSGSLLLTSCMDFFHGL